MRETWRTSAGRGLDKLSIIFGCNARSHRGRSAAFFAYLILDSAGQQCPAEPVSRPATDKETAWNSLGEQLDMQPDV